MKGALAVLLLLLPLHLALGAAPSSPPPGPVAVMPFRNLNEDAALNWLARGLAETLVSDLRANGSLVLVEREQLDAAVSELKLQTDTLTTESSAVRVGRLVGARTIVIGSIQRARDTLRINARFIDVETGTVLDTAKVTGPAERVFSLQDELAARLLGAPVKPRSKRPAAHQAMRALETYGRALETKSDDERTALLRATLATAPSFEYARDELKRQEVRLAELARRAAPQREAMDASLRATMQDPSLPLEQRSLAALNLLKLDHTRARWRTLRQDAERILLLGLPDYHGQLPAESAAFARIVAMEGLHDWDAMLEAGDAFLRTYPHGTMATAVDGLMRSTALARAEYERALREAHEEVSQLERKATNMMADLERRGLPTSDVRRELDIDRCKAFGRRALREHVLRPCRAYYETWSLGVEPLQQHASREAREAEINALVSLRRFTEARERLAAFRAADPEGERASYTRTRVISIRRDEEE
ncbi:putative adenylate cyclase [Myxococcus stipitatus DSM 14675]|uniref:Putative adenylate cyclase n=1 Tax=Myxococcus stipitatus (strain DSM 14675 / JCM 12634 / Mx s8) TaxID=1278073 RepID=L7UCN2_MYXSD|nr:FlgO family outer membrane protein [Myxococcus stipitatus]AGC45352.1 putative adenylate cyclase [Myxococcus stipitatus DSM 14675]